MTGQEVVDFQTIFERGVIINRKVLRDLAEEASKELQSLSIRIIFLNDNNDIKAAMRFWREVLNSKNKLLMREFWGEVSPEKTLGVVDDGCGGYVTYLYDEDIYRKSTRSEFIIYHAFKVWNRKIEESDSWLASLL